MKYSIFIAGLFVMSLGACKSQKNGQSGPVVTSDPSVYKGVTDNNCAVEVAFGSAGAGIDGKTLDEVNKLIASKNLASSSKNVGREGETRICLPLTELKGNEKKDFIEQLKKIVKAGQMASVSIR